MDSSSERVRSDTPPPQSTLKYLQNKTRKYLHYKIQENMAYSSLSSILNLCLFIFVLVGVLEGVLEGVVGVEGMVIRIIPLTPNSISQSEEQRFELSRSSSDLASIEDILGSFIHQSQLYQAQREGWDADFADESSVSIPSSFVVRHLSSPIDRTRVIVYQNVNNDGEDQEHDIDDGFGNSLVGSLFGSLFGPYDQSDQSDNSKPHISSSDIESPNKERSSILSGSAPLKITIIRQPSISTMDPLDLISRVMDMSMISRISRIMDIIQSSQGGQGGEDPPSPPHPHTTTPGDSAVDKSHDLPSEFKSGTGNGNGNVEFDMTSEPGKLKMQFA